VNEQQQETALARTEGFESLTIERAGFTTTTGFALLQRGAKLLAESTLLPDVYHDNVSNCAIVLELAQRLQASPIMVAQNLYVVHGRPSWSSQFLIAGVNQCGRFTALQYEWQGAAADGDLWGCRAWATEVSTGQRVQGPVVTIKIAKDEGWFSRNGSKWKTLPELMLMYRAATFFARTHAPELTMGLPTREEVFDTIDAEAVNTETGEIVGRKPRLVQMPQAKVTDLETKPAAGDTKPPKAQTKPPKADKDPAAETRPVATPATSQPAQTNGGSAPASPATTQVPPVASSVPAQNSEPVYHVTKVDQKKDRNGKTYFLIATKEGLTAHTCSTTVAGDAAEAREDGRAVTFQGTTTAFSVAPLRVDKVIPAERMPGEDDQ
jgi:hypothetical protein